MECIVNPKQFKLMLNNKILGEPDLIDSKINFIGKNNILVCDNNINLENVVLNFNGDNSIVYLSSNLSNNFNLTIYNNSSVYFGRDILLGDSIKIYVYESQNIIIGDDCVIGDNVIISTADDYPIYNSEDKKRINYSKSVFIGDHVWIGHLSYISMGVRIGSGSILNSCSFVPAYGVVPSNMFLSGNPAKIINEDVFFTKDFLGSFREDDSFDSKDYKSNVFIFNNVNDETLDFNNIDKIFIDLDVEGRMEFIRKLFVQNKRRNRFTIK